jgi:hypothetical protein
MSETLTETGRITLILDTCTTIPLSERICVELTASQVAQSPFLHTLVTRATTRDIRHIRFRFTCTNAVLGHLQDYFLLTQTEEGLRLTATTTWLQTLDRGVYLPLLSVSTYFQLLPLCLELCRLLAVASWDPLVNPLRDEEQRQLHRLCAPYIK